MELLTSYSSQTGQAIWTELPLTAGAAYIRVFIFISTLSTTF